MKIMIADDDFVCRMLLQKLLSPLGECVTVINGLEAINAFRVALSEKAPFDLLCLDIMMPEMDGQDALKAIRRIEHEYGVPYDKETKILMTTALGDPRNVIEAYNKGGATTYIVKPITKQGLMDKLKEMQLL